MIWSFKGRQTTNDGRPLRLTEEISLKRRIEKYPDQKHLITPSPDHMMIQYEYRNNE